MTVDVTPFAAPRGPTPGRLYDGCRAEVPAAPLASPPERVPAGGGAPPPPARATASFSSSGDSRASPATLRPFSATYGVASTPARPAATPALSTWAIRRPPFTQAA